jgi:hypothetical protein
MTLENHIDIFLQKIMKLSFFLSIYFPRMVQDFNSFTLYSTVHANYFNKESHEKPLFSFPTVSSCEPCPTAAANTGVCIRDYSRVFVLARCAALVQRSVRARAVRGGPR